MGQHERRAAQATGVPDFSSSRIVEVHAFWQNNRPGGLGLARGFAHESDAGNAFAAAVERALRFFDARRTPADCVAELAAIGRKRAYTREEADRAIAAIHWLERRRHIASDEYNGIVWYALRERNLVAISASELDWSSLQRAMGVDKLEHRLLDDADFETAMRAILHADPTN